MNCTHCTDSTAGPCDQDGLTDETGGVKDGHCMLPNRVIMYSKLLQWLSTHGMDVDIPVEPRLVPGLFLKNIADIFPSKPFCRCRLWIVR